MEIGITLEQFNNLKDNLRVFGIDITYDAGANEWVPNPFMLVGALLETIGIAQNKWSDILDQALAKIELIRKINRLYQQEHPNQDIALEDFMRQLKEDEVYFIRSEEEEEEEEEE